MLSARVCGLKSSGLLKLELMSYQTVTDLQVE